MIPQQDQPIRKNNFFLPAHIGQTLVKLHQDLSAVTDSCDPKTIPPDIVEVEIAIAKCSVVRKTLLDDDDIDDREKTWAKINPRHQIQMETPYKRRLFGLLHSADEIDQLPVNQHTKSDILGAQVMFVKYLKRLRFFQAYKLYTVVIAPWFR